MADRRLRRSWRMPLVAVAVLVATGSIAVVPQAGAQVEPPEIAMDLGDRVVPAGHFVTLTATASGGPGDMTNLVSTDGGVTWNPISGCGNCSFTGGIIPATTLEDSGNLFRIEFTNEAGTVSTRAATLTVCPSIVSPGCGATMLVSPSENVLSGEAIEVTASGLPPSYPTWTVELRTCQVEVARCSAGSETLTYAQDGTLTGTFHPSRLLNIAFECGINATCVVRASVGGATVAEHPISFLPIRPDARLRNRDIQTIAFDDLYLRFGSQQTRAHSIELGGKWTYAVQVQNDGPNVDDILIEAAQFIDGPAAVRYFVGYYDVTAYFTGGGFTFDDMEVGEVRQFAVQFLAEPDAFGVPRTTITMSSKTDPTAQDVITLLVSTGRVNDPNT